MWGHPRGLSTLFFTEMWERLSYYGMRGLLILFMTAPVAVGGLGFATEKAAMIYGLYTAAVYFSAIPGGFVADRLLGQRKSVLVGGILIACGHYSMFFNRLPLFYAGLVLIVMGTGLLKPNVSAIVGQLYAPEDARRDAGFSIFYMGINLGAFLAPFICGSLGEKVGWHWGFGAAGVGMTIGLIQYVLGSQRLGDAGQMKHKPEAPGRLWLTLALAVAGFAGAFYLLWDYQDWLLLTGILLLFVWFLKQSAPGQERRRVAAIVVLFVFSTLFWGGFEQAGSSLNLFARDVTDRVVGGWQLPTSWFQSVNSMFLVLLAPVLTLIWARLGKREPSSPAKFAYGLFFLGLGFLLIAGAALVSARAGNARVSPLWLIGLYLCHTIGELCLSPVGLSTVTKLAPERLVGSMMGVWFLSISLGNFIGGRVAGLFEAFPLPQLFGAVFLTSIAAALVLALLTKPIRNLMSGVH